METERTPCMGRTTQLTMRYTVILVELLKRELKGYTVYPQKVSQSHTLYQIYTTNHLGVINVKYTEDVNPKMYVVIDSVGPWYHRDIYTVSCQWKRLNNYCTFVAGPPQSDTTYNTLNHGTQPQCDTTLNHGTQPQSDTTYSSLDHGTESQNTTTMST